MKIRVALSLLLLPTLSSAQRLTDNDPKPLSAAEELRRFKVPEGFEVQLVADETQIHKPININFDTAGRLWASGSQHYPWPAARDASGNRIPDFEKAYDAIAGAFGAKGKAPPFSEEANDTVRVLSDFGPDGRAGKAKIFADKLNIPSGVQPLPGGNSVVVYSIPNIWLMTDTDHDGVADKREILYGPFGFLDTHGGSSSYTSWIDGWIYGTHGFRNHSEVKDRAGRVTVFDSGNTYRFRPDGSKIEYWSHGQTNPFGLCFDPFGNLYSADCHSKPVYLLLYGGYYEGLGKQHDGLGFGPAITNDDHGSTGICGIAYYAAEQFPADYRDNIFVGNCVTSRINRDKLEWRGSTPKAVRQADFLTCNDPWFRPVDVKLGPDGALYIADFYNLVIGHYEVPLTDPRRDNMRGRIWRVVYRGDGRVTGNSSLTDLTRLEAPALIEKLGDTNLTVRVLATRELIERVGEKALPLLRKLLSDGAGRPEKNSAQSAAERESNAQRAHALVAFSQLLPAPINSDDQKILADAQKAGGEIARVFGLKMRAAKVAPDRADRGPIVETLLADTPATVQRASWEALAHSPKDLIGADPRELVRRLDSTDPELIYQARVALREYFKLPGTLGAIGTTGPETRFIVDTLLAVQTPEAADFVLKFLEETKLKSGRSGELVRHVALRIPDERLSSIGGLVGLVKDAPIAKQLDVAENIAQAMRQRGKSLPNELSDWTERVMLDALGDRDEGIIKRGIDAVKEVRTNKKYDPLVRIIQDARRPGPLRAAALDAIANIDRGTDALIAALNDPSSMTSRKRAAELLGQKCGAGSPTAAARPDESVDPCESLLVALPTAPWELATTIAAGLSNHDASCARLLALIENGKASPALLRHKSVSAPLGSRTPALRERAASLTKDLPPEDARLDALIAQRVNDYRAANADANHGAEVFQQTCAACHKVKNVGGNLAPNLDGVAVRGLHRLLEDILDPNRNVDPAFAQVIIETNDGQLVAGVGPHVEGELVVMNDALGKPVSVARKQIKSQIQSKLSLMPPNFEQLLSGNDLNDLVAFLLTQSTAAAK